MTTNVVTKPRGKQEEDVSNLVYVVVWPEVDGNIIGNGEHFHIYFQ